MTKLLRFKSYPINESEKEEDHSTPIENVCKKEFILDAGKYTLVWYPDADGFRLIFPDGKYLWNKATILKITGEDNPYAEYENGSLLAWMRETVAELQKNPVSANYESESEDSSINLKRFYYISDEGQASKIDISKGGLITIRVPERVISGSPDELFEQMPELGYLYRGELLDVVRLKFKEVTNVTFNK
jgi:hypothetical protein